MLREGYQHVFSDSICNQDAVAHFQVLTGSPFSIVVAPAAADPANCIATIKSSGGEERSIEAGTELLVTTRLCDCFGNATELSGQSVLYQTSKVMRWPFESADGHSWYWVPQLATPFALAKARPSVPFIVALLAAPSCTFTKAPLSRPKAYFTLLYIALICSAHLLDFVLMMQCLDLICSAWPVSLQVMPARWP